MGENTYSAGTLLDPPLTEFGANCIIGHDAVLICHAIEGSRFALSRIRVGDNVTIGATAVIMSGVTIGDGAIVSAGAVVPKDTQIGPGEVWGGVPAQAPQVAIGHGCRGILQIDASNRRVWTDIEHGLRDSVEQRRRGFFGFVARGKAVRPGGPSRRQPKKTRPWRKAQPFK